MNIKKGINIYNELPGGYDAVSINSGTVFHTEQEMEIVNFQGYNFRPQYEDYAYAAKRDWRKLQLKEIDCLDSNGSERNDYNTVYLGEIPDNLKSFFEELGLAKSKDRNEVFDNFGKDPEKTLAISKAMQAFLKPISGEKSFHFHCIGVNLPNIEMVACDTTKLAREFKQEDKRYMGMHNDGAQVMTLYTAHKFGNRISINLGKDDRSFLFVNLSMIQAINMLKQKIDIKKHDVNISNIPRFFFKHFPDYPVIRIKQKPYQFYIAPTDNCFHDGSTLGSKLLDIAIVYFGAFRY